MKSYYYRDPDRQDRPNLSPLRLACFYKVNEHGWTIHFGPDSQPVTAFSFRAFAIERRELVEDGYVVFTEVEFQKAKQMGLIEEIKDLRFDDNGDPIDGDDIA